MTNSSIFTRVFALALCVLMFAGILTACFQNTESNPEISTQSPTNSTVGTTTTGGQVENEPNEDPTPVDPNQIFSGSTTLANDALIYGTLANDVFIGGEEGVAAIIPADVKVEAGASSLSLSVKKVEDENLADALSNLDVHISGVALDNLVPMTVKLGAILPIGLSQTELKFYHIENDTPVLMTRVNSVTDFAIHNQYVYDEATGDVTIYVASFSEFVAVKSTASVWEDNIEADTSWYNENDTEFTLEDVADFLGFRDLVDTGVTFEGKTVILGVDIDLKNKPFDPIGFGYWYEKNVVEGKDQNTVFMGTFDGGNHTIYNLYENCWELDPDKENYSTYTYSTAGAGLFASIKNATIKNLAVSGAEIVFECVDMGVVVGYAQGTCHFENIIVTDSKIANYNRYTGGVVGEVSYGPYGIDTSLGYSHTFKNITVDSSVTVSGLWGSFGCGMGGVIGGKWGDATVYMENVVSAPTMDVYNDVVSAYQWYAFRGCGMLIGHTEEPYSDGRHSGNATASFLTCKNVNVYYGDWVDYNYYQFSNQDSATGRSYPWVRAEAGKYCDAFSNIRYGVPTHTVEGVTTAVSELSLEELEKVATDHVVITFDQLYGADRGMYGTNKHEGVNVSYSSPKTFYIENNVGWKNLTLHYIYEIGEETWTTVPDGIELTEMNGVYRIDLPVGATSFTITADGGYTSKEFIVNELTEKETYLVHDHDFSNNNECECGATQVETWEKLTNETELKVGDSIVFVYGDEMGLSGFSTSNTIYGIGTQYTDLPTDLMIFEVVAGSTNGTIAFKNGDKYLYWTSGNSLSTNTTLSANTSWTVTVDENGNAIVANAKDNTRTIQWNATNPRFACYTSAQKEISIYVKTEKITCSKCVMQTVDHKDASCEVAGYTTTQCTVCGKVETNTIDALSHDYTGANPYICENNCGVHNLPEAGSTITIQQALWIAETLENSKETSGKYIITGVIDDKDDPSNTGATTITDDGSSIYITTIHNVDGSIRHDAFTVKLKDGDTITVSAKIAKNDSGEPQLHETRLNAHTDTNPADHTCDICGAIEITNHIDENSDKLCDICGNPIEGGSTEPTPDPETPNQTTVSMDIFANKGSLVDKVITWTSGDVTVSNAQGSTAIRTADTDHFRVYANSTVTISVNGGKITQVAITCTSNDYATVMKTSAENTGYEVTVNGSVVTITVDNADSITFKASAQTRISKVEVTYTAGNESGETPETPCEHTNTTTTSTATCTESGVETVTCNDCGVTVSTTNVEALGHTTDNGVCERCSETIGGTSEPTLKEKTYLYTFTAKQYTANGIKALGDVSWTLAGNGGYWGYDSTKGQQFGSGSSPYKSMTLTSTSFSNVKEIVINTSGASSVNATFTVTVNGKQVGSSTKITTTATDYTFTLDEAVTGEIVITYTQTSSKALYIKSISVTYAE